MSAGNGNPSRGGEGVKKNVAFKHPRKQDKQNIVKSLNVSMDWCHNHSIGDREGARAFRGRMLSGYRSKPREFKTFINRGQLPIVTYDLPVPSHLNVCGAPEDKWHDLHRITVYNGLAYKREEILEALKLLMIQLEPLMWHYLGLDATFYISTITSSYNVVISRPDFTVNMRIKMPDGLFLKSQLVAGFPQIDRPNTYEKLRPVMTRRYNLSTRTMDMSMLHCDTEASVFLGCSSFQSIIITFAYILCKDFPEVETLDLSYNNIDSIRELAVIVKGLPNIHVLDLSFNEIPEYQLASLDTLPITELRIMGHYKNRIICFEKYEHDLIENCRKLFPKLMKLNEVVFDSSTIPLPFDNTVLRLPVTRQNFFCSAEGESVARQFVLTYFRVFDSEDRADLAKFYNEESCFNLTIRESYLSEMRTDARLGWAAFNGSELVLSSQEALGPIGGSKIERPRTVVQFLENMPKTDHHIHSFTMDVTCFQLPLLSVTLTGQFTQLTCGPLASPVHHFMRTFIISVSESNCSIVCDTVSVSKLTLWQAKKVGVSLEDQEHDVVGLRMLRELENLSVNESIPSCNKSFLL